MNREERIQKQNELKNLVKEGGMTLEEISEKIGIKIRTLQGWMSKLSIKKANKIKHKEDVVRLKMKGLTNSAIAEQLGVSEKTINNVICKIKKLKQMEYIDFYTKKVVFSDKIITIEDQLLNYIRLNSDSFDKSKYKFVFLKDIDQQSTYYFFEKPQFNIFSEELLEYFEGCLEVYNNTYFKQKRSRRTSKSVSNAVYRFVDNNEGTIYIGKATSLGCRLASHKSSGHLSVDCYKDVFKVEYVSFDTSDDMDLAERLLISKHKPKFNTEFTNMDFTIVDVKMEDFEWESIDFKF